MSEVSPSPSPNNHKKSQHEGWLFLTLGWLSGRPERLPSSQPEQRPEQQHQPERPGQQRQQPERQQELQPEPEQQQELQQRPEQQELLPSWHNQQQR
jgi:hypothetical protein